MKAIPYIVLVLVAAAVYFYFLISAAPPANNQPMEPFLSLPWGVIPSKVEAQRGKPLAKNLFGHHYNDRLIWGAVANEYFRFTKSRLSAYECRLEIAAGTESKKELLLTCIRAAALSQILEPEIFVTADGLTEFIWDDDTLMQITVLRKRTPVQINVVLYQSDSVYNAEIMWLIADLRSADMRTAREAVLQSLLAGACELSFWAGFYLRLH